MTTLTPQKFTMDAYSDGETFSGYTTGQFWNGWACPLFTKQEAMRLMEVNNAYASDFDYFQLIEFDEAKDCFIIREADEDPADAMEFGKEIINDQEFYAVGSNYWCWTEADETEDAELEGF